MPYAAEDSSFLTGFRRDRSEVEKAVFSMDNIYNDLLGEGRTGTC